MQQRKSKSDPPKLNLLHPDMLSDEGIWTRIQSVWWLAKEDLAIRKFSSHLEAQMVDKGFDVPTNYRDDRVAWEIVEILSQRGIPIARRTVAKYRTELNILPSNMRRKY